MKSEIIIFLSPFLPSHFQWLPSPVGAVLKPEHAHCCLISVGISKHILVPFILNPYKRSLVVQNSLLASSYIYLECLLKSIITSFNIVLLIQVRSQGPVQFKSPQVWTEIMLSYFYIIIYSCDPFNRKNSIMGAPYCSRLGRTRSWSWWRYNVFSENPVRKKPNAVYLRRDDWKGIQQY